MSILALTLSHYTNEGGIAPYSTTQEDSRGDKPRGLWVSVDGEDDWPTWCDAEDYGLGANRFVVTLTAEANILHLASAQELVEFSEEYLTDDDATTPRYLRSWTIDWARVAEKYQGIVIAPYQWSMRSDDRSRWYWGWDVASGCIWDADAIQAVLR